MTIASDLASAARRRFLNGLGLSITCTGAIAGAGALGFVGAASAKTDAPAPAGKPDAAAQGGSFPTKDYDWTKRRWAFGVDVNKCIGCLRCVEACKAENDVPRNANQFRTWVERYVHIEGEASMRIDSQQDPVNIEASGSQKEYRFADRYKGAKVDKAFFVPKLCNQCSHPACVQVCPVGATYKTEDGVVLVDDKRCIGCRYCIQACPYGARTFDERRRVPDKCTWCYHRITKGLQPACVDSCPTGARVFGDMRDRESTISLFVRNNRVQVLRPESGNSPNVFYVGLDKEVS
ncbi:MAG: 4Fe-4S dicluster domain-containing protein [Rubrivivax sp.]|nr:4Fe-4S dicluster domain-containing protein [Rubrivivax sp.]